MSEKKKTIITPLGTCKFPELDGKSTGDDGLTKYSVMLTFDPKDKEVKQFLKVLDDEYALVKDGNTPPYKDDFAKTEDGGKEKTGLVAVTMTSKYPIKFFDARKTEIKDVNVGWGTKAKAAIKLGDFDFRGKRGISKFLIALQIIELKESGYTAESLGFEEAEGYTAADMPEELPF